MYYRKRDHLTIVELKTKTESLSLDSIISILWDRPSSVIYVELDSVLYGIVTTGDIIRAFFGGGADAVESTLNFLPFRLSADI